MSDPFEAFDSALNLNAPETTQQNLFEDPAAEFLAREQAEMDKIENNDLSNDAFGDFNAPVQQNEPAQSNEFIESDPFGIETNPSSQVNGNVEETKQNNDLYSAISTADRFSNESGKIKVWREEQKLRLETKDAEEVAKKKELKETAKKELEDWYKNRQEQLKKTQANNKAAEADLVRQDSQPGQEWERLAKLCDFNPKSNKNTRDVGRMRSILLQLKQQPLVR